MSDFMITRRGGSGNGFAAIAVIYPAGSTCTCTNGPKTLTAKDASGSYPFLVPSSGTWTISCTDGTETASSSVTITTQYQTESVALSYSYFVFKDGSFQNAISMTGYYLTINNMLLTMVNSGQGSGYSPAAAVVYSTDAKIVVPKPTLKCRVVSYYGGTGYQSTRTFHLGLTSAKGSTTYVAEQIQTGPNTDFEFAIDVSTLIGESYYLTMSMDNYSGTSKVEISEIKFTSGGVA